MLCQMDMALIFNLITKKNFFSVMAEQSLTEDIGMVVGFSRRESDIKQKRFN
ncbi:hypothetical protein [Vibrio harveyi]|uniref:hypothetical protein n=1 Tax=Vibrio harveyi TaxID=669 RepID=UPI00217D014F|nr:hypothetical protein [Vibrio harveyi]